MKRVYIVVTHISSNSLIEKKGDEHWTQYITAVFANEKAAKDYIAKDEKIKRKFNKGKFSMDEYLELETWDIE